MANSDNTRAAAHHEAGHAAWELLHDRRVDRIWVDNEGRGSTRTFQHDVLGELCEGEIDPQSVKTRIYEQVDNLLAGVVAECMFKGTDNAAGWLKATGRINLMSPCRGYDIADAAWLLHKVAGHAGKSHECSDCPVALRGRMEQVAMKLRKQRSNWESLAEAVLASSIRELNSDQILAAWCSLPGLP